jgi:ABC-type antimicrobial peptide transport system permease subunit
LGDDPGAFAPRLRTLAGEVDAAATISNLSALDEVLSLNTAFMGWIKIGGGILLGILVTLSVSGIYALMSFTVSERTREIGIRTALGAQRSSVVFTIAKRAFVQLGLGILLGMPIVAGLLYALKEVGRISTQSPILLTFLVGAFGDGRDRSARLHRAHVARAEDHAH